MTDEQLDAVRALLRDPQLHPAEWWTEFYNYDPNASTAMTSADREFVPFARDMIEEMLDHIDNLKVVNFKYGQLVRFIKLYTDEPLAAASVGIIGIKWVDDLRLEIADLKSRLKEVNGGNDPGRSGST